MADPFAPWDAPETTKKMRSILVLADPTRLELATSAVTGQRSNQLSYESTTYCLYINIKDDKKQVARR